MRTIFLMVFLINTLIGFSQDFIVEKVQLTETIANENVSEIPRLKDTSNESNPAVNYINSQILDLFRIDSYSQSEIEDFRWFDVRYSSDIKDSILYLAYTGEYNGAYPNYVYDELFFNLKSGEPLKLTYIPFQALFTLSGYLDFIHKYWLEGVKNEFIAAIECAEFEPYCNYYDIDYEANSNRLSISLTDDCYPHVALGCSPTYSISIELDSIKHFLNPIGNYMLLESKYMAMTPIEKFHENEKLKERIPDNVFLFGIIGDTYPFSMAINLDNKEQSFGLYYYDAKLQKIELKGRCNDTSMFLTETVNAKETGYFEFDTNIDDYPIYGRWLNSTKTKSLNVEFTKILTCKGN